MRSCMKQLVSRMLKMSASFVLGSSKSSTYLRGYASGFDSPAALLGTRRVLARRGWVGEKAGHFEHPVEGYASCPRRVGHQSAAVPTWFFWNMFILITALGLWGFGLVWADEGPLPGPRTIVVALDGTGDYVSLQEAVDAAMKGDTVFVKAGHYPQDVTIHSKEKIKLVGAGVDQVTILGRDIVVGALHVGKWPYGATDIEISDMTINDRDPEENNPLPIEQANRHGERS